MTKLSWHAPEYIHTEKTADWYWILAIVTVTVVLIAVILNNVIFGMLIIVASSTLTLLAGRKPQKVHIEISDRRISVGRIHYNYAEMESFWVEKRQIFPKLVLKSKKVFLPYISILIEEVEPEKVRQALSDHLPEEEHVEPLLEKILIYLGF